MPSASYMHADKLFINVMGQMYLKGKIYFEMDKFTPDQWRANTDPLLAKMGINEHDLYAVDIIKHKKLIEELPFVYQAGKFHFRREADWIDFRSRLFALGRDDTGRTLSNEDIFSDTWLYRYASLISNFARKNSEVFVYPEE